MNDKHAVWEENLNQEFVVQQDDEDEEHDADDHMVEMIKLTANDYDTDGTSWNETTGSVNGHAIHCLVHVQVVKRVVSSSLLFLISVVTASFVAEVLIIKHRVSNGGMLNSLLATTVPHRHYLGNEAELKRSLWAFENG